MALTIDHPSFAARVASKSSWTRRVIELNSCILPDLVSRLNSQVCDPYLARPVSELLPTHSLHRSAVNTRVGLLLEYGLAQVWNQALLASGFQCTYMVANQFADFTLRNSAHSPLLRVEVKALHTLADEKSANFASPLRSMRPRGDVLAILLWDWKEWISEGIEVSSPRVIDSCGVDAYSIAAARDQGWLRSKRGSSRFKAIDTNGPVIKTSGALKDEGGNFGKLTRIVSRQRPVPQTLEETYSYQALREFVDRIPR